MDPRIHYVLVLPDWEMDDVTPFQGFTWGLIEFDWALVRLTALPGNAVEWAQPRAMRLAARATGMSGWRWFPLTAPTLKHLAVSEQAPFWVLFSQDKATARAVSSWASIQRGPVLHISTHTAPDALAPKELTIARLQALCLEALEVFRRPETGEETAELAALIRRWKRPRPRWKLMEDRWLGPNVASEMVLQSEGLAPSPSVARANHDEAAHIRAIERSIKAIHRLRDEIPSGYELVQRLPLRPDTILIAPAMYRFMHQVRPNRRLPKEIEFSRALRLLQRQSTYIFAETAEEWKKLLTGEAAGFLMRQRVQELRLQTSAVGIMAASNAAVAIRLPNSVNRTAGLVGQLANHIRANPRGEARTPKVFGVVQRALHQSVPSVALKAIMRSKSGVKLIADAPLEWLPVNGLPLFLRHDVSRIPVTPGNLTFGELAVRDPIFLSPGMFDDVLILTSFQPDDRIRDHLTGAMQAIRGLASESFHPRIHEVNSTAELIEALNAYRGPMVIFDMHGSHGSPSDIGTLRIGVEDVDIWMLRGQIRVPPIVVLSACDTHAVDRSHVTPANGLISCGARAVLGTLLPVQSGRAAAFAARLVTRARSYTVAVNARGRAVSWKELVSGMLRLQYSTDILLALQRVGQIDEPQREELTTAASMLVHTQRGAWFEDFIDLVAKQIGMPSEDVKHRALTQLAFTDGIRYVHVGTPESILITNDASESR